MNHHVGGRGPRSSASASFPRTSPPLSLNSVWAEMRAAPQRSVPSRTRTWTLQLGSGSGARARSRTVGPPRARVEFCFPFTHGLCRRATWA